MKYIHAGTNDELPDAIDRFLEADAACLMVVDVDEEDKVK